MSPSPIRILIVDDHPVLRAGLAAIIDGHDDMSVVGEASDGAEAVERFGKISPDVTLMDLQMPRLRGVEAITLIRAEHPHARILVLTTYSGDAQAARALRAGAVGYLLKSAVRHELIDVIRSVHAGRKHVPAAIAQEMAFRSPQDILSDRELAVLGCVAEGHANKEIARRLFVSEETIKAHMRSIFTKLNVVDRTQAVTVALRRGIIEL